MILMTGDTHGDSGRIERLCEKIKTTPEDVIIILSDAGINYYGGICDETAPRVVEAGAGYLVAGSAVFSNKDHASAIKELRSCAMS